MNIHSLLLNPILILLFCGIHVAYIFFTLKFITLHLSTLNLIYHKAVQISQG